MYIIILPHDGRIPKKDKINAYIMHVRIINLTGLDFALNFILCNCPISLDDVFIDKKDTRKELKHIYINKVVSTKRHKLRMRRRENLLVKQFYISELLLAHNEGKLLFFLVRNNLWHINVDSIRSFFPNTISTYLCSYNN